MGDSTAYLRLTPPVMNKTITKPKPQQSPSESKRRRRLQSKAQVLLA
jgi:hypothetical protein